MARAERAYDFSALRLSFSAGERLPPAIRQRWEAWTGSRMLDSIGTTETFAPYLSETADGGPACAASRASATWKCRTPGTPTRHPTPSPWTCPVAV